MERNMEVQWREWCILIRCHVISNEESLTPAQIQQIVRKEENKAVPFQYFGYLTFEDMLREIPGLKLVEVNGNVIVNLQPLDSNKLIVNLVRKQRKSSPTKERMKNLGVKAPKPTSSSSRSVPNRLIQDRVSVSDNNRSFSTEPQRRPTPSPTAQSTPARSNSYDATRTATTPLMQKPITPPPTALMQKLITPPTTSPHQKPQQPTPPVPKTSSNQSRLSPPSCIQQKVQMPQVPAPRLNLAQRLNVAQQRPISVPTSEDPRTLLRTFVDNKGLTGPEYRKCYSILGEWHTAVVVNGETYQTFPSNGAATKEEAVKVVAKIALTALIEKFNNLSIQSMMTTTNDRSLILERVAEIVGVHPNGYFESHVIQMYQERYNERLPDDWVFIVSSIVNATLATTNDLILSLRRQNN